MAESSYRAVPPECRETAVSRNLALMAASFERFVGRPLVDTGQADLVQSLWLAPFAIVAHGTQADPVFFFGNAAALDLFETDWAAFTAMPSRYSAEAPARAERQRLMERVSTQGFIDDYAGVRISAKGRRFRIGPAVVWNILDEAGDCHGQAATFMLPLQEADRP